MHCNKKPFYLKSNGVDSSTMDAYLMHVVSFTISFWSCYYNIILDLLWCWLICKHVNIHLSKILSTAVDLQTRAWKECTYCCGGGGGGDDDAIPTVVVGCCCKVASSKGEESSSDLKQRWIHELYSRPAQATGDALKLHALGNAGMSISSNEGLYWLRFLF